MTPPRILVTRPAEDAGRLAALLVERGLEPVGVPAIAIDVESAAPGVAAMLASLEDADWLVITSANGATAVGSQLAGRALPERLKVAAVGPATAEALRRRGIRVDHVPDRYRTGAIADGLGNVEARRVVLARADAATPELRDILLARGARVEEVVAYRTVEGPAASRDRLRAELAAGLSGITFTSGSTVRGLLRLAAQPDRMRLRALPALCIGPVTADAAARAGFHVPVVAGTHTTAALADAVADYFATRRPRHAREPKGNR
ncbi:MAG TPA: uroporphyrinogen-III synthase [candidate division Zixibacteria bacterium]|nr:uroporphyrinogen-III synthase [candidate division Zixibacteria bacterium]